ncbi:hypothetical protein EYR40_008564 [Pleurotus pulmonarius]|nr:hypothetical protein EYR36_009383 [Pleurotus pulmonarius]KAF4592880.1 hypothetical protein EYR38_008586 [Pleurotus pulmonarius]KAF4593770.1 hypothetical protein EYR40_008564 [Pleurotus pulmonarius]
MLPNTSMSSSACSICIDRLKAPIALPCGHVYCHECILNTIHQITPYTTQHNCPTCRAPFSTVNIDPNFVPSHLRQYITPSIRKLYMEEQMDSWPSASSGALTDKDIARIMAENESLRTSCGLWQRRAEVQAAATIGLIGLTRFARDRAVELKQERDSLRTKYEAFKRKYAHLEADDPETTFSPPRSPSSQFPEPSLPEMPSSHPISSLLAEGTVPRSALQPPEAESPLGLSLLSLPDAAPQLEDLFSDSDLSRPPAKRRRTDSPTSSKSSSVSASASPLSKPRTQQRKGAPSTASLRRSPRNDSR